MEFLNPQNPCSLLLFMRQLSSPTQYNLHKPPRAQLPHNLFPHSTFVPQHLHQAKPNSSIDTIINGVVWEESTLIMVLFTEGHYAATILWSWI